MKYFRIIKNAARSWSEDKASVWAASLAYFTVFALSPLLLILISVVGIFFGEQAIQGQLFDQLQGFVGEDAAAIIEKGVSNTSNSSGNVLSIIVGVITLILGATGVFDHIQRAFNFIWKVEIKPKAGIKVLLIDKLLSFSMLIIIGFLLAVSLVLSSAISIAANYFQTFLFMPIYLLQITNIVITLLVLGILFSAMFKLLPDVEIPLRAVIPGALLTSLLFIVGQTLIGFYIGRTAYTSTYGAAGSLMMILVWVYFSVQILLFGAEFTKAYAKNENIKVVPSRNAISTKAPVKNEVIEKRRLDPTGYVILGASWIISQLLSKVGTKNKK